MNYYVIIAAGGIGTRMHTNTPKQYLLLHNTPIIIQTINQFIKALPAMHCIVVVPNQFIAETKSLLQQNNISQYCTIIEGGTTRYHSVQNGVKTINDDEAIVLVHDAARCLVTVQLIQNCVQQTLEKGNAVPAIALTDSLRKINMDGSNTIINRSTVKSIQTPQCFTLNVLQKAFVAEYNDSFTDEASVVEQLGIAINLIEGESTNIKITNPIDIVIAEKIMKL